MRRPVLLVFAWTLLAMIAAACATYRHDLERARNHYQQNQYEAALALLRVLEHDIDSFSGGEQAQYAYVRGMTDYRLADLAPRGGGAGVADPRKGYRDNARHWLAIAVAIEKDTPGGITGDEKQRMFDALAELNREVYGGAESVPGEPAAADAGAPPPAAPVEEVPAAKAP
jgi:hypothetical protein